MAYDAYLKLDGINGESKRDGFEKTIELLSFSWGASNPKTLGPGEGTGSGKVTISGLSFMKHTDSTSPQLFQNCCNGKHFPKGSVTFLKAGGKAPVDYLKYEFTEVYVESIQWGGGGGEDTPSESVSLAFASVNVTYTPQKTDGTKGTPVVAGWDLKANKAK
jgi:type VI secretion system secreted protein Hcp